MISTRLTELLDIEAPVMLAGMGGVSYHELAAAVSNAGGFGCLGASTMSDEVMVEEIARTAVSYTHLDVYKRQVLRCAHSYHAP